MIFAPTFPTLYYGYGDRIRIVDAWVQISVRPYATTAEGLWSKSRDCTGGGETSCGRVGT